MEELPNRKRFSSQHGDLSVVEAAQYHRVPGVETLFMATPALGFSSINISDQRLFDSGTGAYLGVNYHGLSFMSSYTSLETTSFLTKPSDVRWKKGFFDIGYSLKPTAKWDMTFALTYTRSTLDAPLYPDVTRDSYETVLEWTNFFTFSDTDRLTFGALFNHEQGIETYLGTPSFNDVDGSRSSTGLYIQHEHKFTPDLKLIGGVQINKIGNLSVNAVPRAGILWNPSTHVTLKTLYGGAFHAASLFQTLINYPMFKGNPNLRPETVGTLDVQASYENNRVQGSAGYFHSRQANLIVPQLLTAPAYINLQQAAIFQGFDADGKYYLHQNWFLLGSAIYFATHSAVESSNVTPIPSFAAKAGISYSSKKGIDLSLFDAYQGHISGFAAALNPHPDAVHTLNAHIRLDLAKYLHKDSATGFAFFLNATNLTNQQIWLPDNYAYPPNTDPLNNRRTLLFGFEIFGKRESN